ncbi:long-chain-acyl-CoA synthetase [Deltaproteobacteria bacterium TL4]
MDVQRLMDNLPTTINNTRLFLGKLPSIIEALLDVKITDKTITKSIGTYIERNASRYPSQTAILFEEKRYTHGEYNEWVNRYANYFIEQGLKKGDSVAVLIENRPEILVCVGALAKIGAIAALINYNQRQRALVHSFKLSHPKMFIIGEELVDAFEEIKPELNLTPKQPVFFIPDHGEKDAPKGYKDLEKISKESPTSNPSTTKNVMLKDPCFYVYTSGTTGLPKASIMTNFRWIKAAAAFGMVCLDLKPTDILYAPLPLYHNTALTVAWSGLAARGAAIAMRRKFSASQFWDDTRKFNANIFCYIGELCRYLINQPVKLDDANNPISKMIGNGLRPDIWKKFKQRFGITEVYELYGASEGNILFINLLNLDCTVGLCPAPYALVKYDIDADEPIKDSKGHLIKVAKGEVGLLLGEVSEKFAFDGYTDPAASEKKLLRNVFRPGDIWFNSGDLLKDQGFFHAQFVDRVGDTFRWKSENVSTTEVDEVCNLFEAVEASTIYGVEIPGANGRAGMAALVLKVPFDEFDFGKFENLLHKELPPYAVPVFLRFQKELEITGTFKHRKVDLKKEGYDVTTLKDKVYVMLPQTKNYVPLTPARYKEILAGTYRF